MVTERLSHSVTFQSHFRWLKGIFAFFNNFTNMATLTYLQLIKVNKSKFKFLCNLIISLLSAGLMFITLHRLSSIWHFLSHSHIGYKWKIVMQKYLSYFSLIFLYHGKSLKIMELCFRLVIHLITTLFQIKSIYWIGVFKQ